MQSIIHTSDTCQHLARLCNEANADRLFVLTDDTTFSLCRQRLSACAPLQQATDITIGSTDSHKTLDSLVQVWTALSNGKASRRSLLINLGGGMVTDLGGFAAATFKRGIRFVNIPTTLLAMVDAAVGGKTGINLNGLKNEVGCFAESEAVFIDTSFLQTLDAHNLRSGYAEMLKHALLESHELWAEHLKVNLDHPDYMLLQQLVEQSIRIKERIVSLDPHEHGIRKALNLGHTIGHALESLALERNRPVLHGYAVAWGLVCELFLSVVHAGFPTTEMRQTVQFIRANYGAFNFTCKDYDYLYERMLHDKKNVSGIIHLTLLNAIGQVSLDQHLSREAIYEAFDFLREG